MDRGRKLLYATIITLSAIVCLNMTVLHGAVNEMVDAHAPDWERVLTRIWVWMMMFTLYVIVIALIVRVPRTRMQRGTLGLVASFAMIMTRTVWQVYFNGGAGLPQPYALYFWTLQAFLTLHFLWSFFMEWFWPGFRSSRRRSIMRGGRAACLLVALTVAASVVGAAAQQNDDEHGDNGRQVTTADSGIEFQVGGYDFERGSGDLPLVMIADRTDNPNGSFVTYTIVVELPDGTFTPLTPCDNIAVRCDLITSPAEGPFAEAQPGDEIGVGN